MRILLLSAILCVSAHATPDSLWARTFGGGRTEVGYGICEEESGDLLAVGLTSTYGAGALDAVLVRFGPTGDVISHATWGGSSDDGAHGIAPVRAGGHIIAGYTMSFGAGARDAWVLRTDEHGDTLWTRTFGTGLQDCCYLALETPDSGFVVSGYRDGPSGWIKGDAWLLRLDAHGDTVWTRSFGGNSEDYAHNVRIAPDGGFLLVGSTMSQGAGMQDAWVLRLDSDGDTLWTRTLGYDLHDVAHDALPCEDGWLVVGTVDGPSAWVGGDVWVLRLDGSGDTLWTRRYGGFSADQAIALCAVPDSGWMLAASSSSFGAGSGDFWMLRVDPSGDTIGTRTFGGSNQEGIIGITACADGGSAAVGFTTSFGSGGHDLWVVRLKPDTASAISEPSSSDRPGRANSVPIIGSRSGLVPAGARIYDACGRRVAQQNARPGVYFIEYGNRSRGKTVIVGNNREE